MDISLSSSLFRLPDLAAMATRTDSDLQSSKNSGHGVINPVAVLHVFEEVAPNLDGPFLCLSLSHLHFDVVDPAQWYIERDRSSMLFNSHLSSHSDMLLEMRF
jgi:hypothetical protein